MPPSSYQRFEMFYLHSRGEITRLHFVRGAYGCIPHSTCTPPCASTSHLETWGSKMTFPSCLHQHSTPHSRWDQHWMSAHDARHSIFLFNFHQLCSNFKVAVNSGSFTHAEKGVSVTNKSDLADRLSIRLWWRFAKSFSLCRRCQFLIGLDCN